MKLYSKLGLLALLTSSALFGMEMPPGKAALVENDIIQIHAHDTTLAKIERRHLKASSMLKALIDETSTDNGIELPESIINDFKIIQDYLICEYGLKEKSTNEKVILEMLSKKSEDELTAIANACQRFELNLLSPLPIKILAIKLNSQEQKEQCLKTGTFGLRLTPDAAKLTTHAMLENSSILVYWLLLEEMFKNKEFKVPISCYYLDENAISYHKEYRFINELEFSNPQKKWFILSQNQKRDICNRAHMARSYGIIKDADSVCIAEKEKFEQGERAYIYELSPDNAYGYFQTQLTPERVALLHYCFECQLKGQYLNYSNGFKAIKEKFPKNIQMLLHFNPGTR